MLEPNHKVVDTKFFLDILGIDSTSGRERALSQILCAEIGKWGCKVEHFAAADGTENLLFCWGKPEIVYCTHMDTVPPYSKPRVCGEVITGRGSCDAKGQVFAMFEACKSLYRSGKTGFALLLLSGEETGSFGAKAFAKESFTAPYLVIGEPTDNAMASACKGTKSFEIKFKGEPVHSGYPQYGKSAVEMFVEFVNRLNGADLPLDPVLGETTYNIGKLHSDNPQNILSPELSCRVYFRTTFATDASIESIVKNAASDAEVKCFGGDIPAYYETLPGIESKPISFGSDAPHLVNFEHKAICGPGSILDAHTSHEQIALSDIEKAVAQYIQMYNSWVG